MRQLCALICFVSLFYGLTVGCHGRGTRIVIDTQPPAPQYEKIPASRGPKYVWVAGHWHWNGHRYVWRKGHYKRVKRGKRWVPGRYKKRRRGWVWIPGHWR